MSYFDLFFLQSEEVLFSVQNVSYLIYLKKIGANHVLLQRVSMLGSLERNHGDGYNHVPSLRVLWRH